jgi:hypothetical protein
MREEPLIERFRKNYYLSKLSKNVREKLFTYGFSDKTAFWLAIGTPIPPLFMRSKGRERAHPASPLYWNIASNKCIECGDTMFIDCMGYGKQK